MARSLKGVALPCVSSQDNLMAKQQKQCKNEVRGVAEREDVCVCACAFVYLFGGVHD